MRITKGTRERLEGETGVESSFEEKEMIEYTKNVISEIKRKGTWIK
jgi:hypothetical protein